MPELPDLLYIQSYLRDNLPGRTIRDVIVKRPVVIRNTLETAFTEAVKHQQFAGITLRGPFIGFELSGRLDLIVNLMLAGRIQHQRPGEAPAGHLCFSIALDDDSRLNLCDDKQMAKAYLVRHGDYRRIPRYENQGTDILSAAFTRRLFHELAGAHRRKQVRVFINDQSIMSAIGNAYADEILFEARLHPKTLVGNLSPEELDRLHTAIPAVMRWGIQNVKEAREPIHVKIREHLKVRNRKGEACPRCGTTIRREGVRGFDVFFCPACQPAKRKLFIDWQSMREGDQAS
jgi:formamidopyrimidine-DNA glycosylase